MKPHPAHRKRHIPPEPVASEPTGAEEIIRAGIRALDNREFAEAARFFKQALAVAPFRADVKELLSLAIDERTYDREELHPQRFEPSQPSLEPLSALQGVRHRQRRTLAARLAIPLITIVALTAVGLAVWAFVALRPNEETETAAPLETRDIQDMVVKAKYYFEDGRYEEAVAQLDFVLRSKPADPEAIQALKAEFHYQQALIAGQKREYVEAIEQLVQAADLDSSQPAYHSELGWMRHLQGRNLRVKNSDDYKRFEEKACEAFEAALAVDPDYLLALDGLWRAKLAIDDVGGAVPALRHVLEIAPTSREGQSAQEELIQRGLLEAALTDLQKLVLDGG